MRFIVKQLIFFGLLLSTIVAAHAAPMLYGVNPYDNTAGSATEPPFPGLRQIDPATGLDLDTKVITLAGEVVNGANGLATNPLTGELFAVLKLQGQSGRQLVTLDPLTGVATSIGDTSEKIAGLTFDSSGTLYGVSGDGGNTPETLFTIDTGTGVLTQFVTLGAGDDGETIAFNPDDGMIYHTSGLGTQNVDEIFESIDLGTKAD